MTPRTSPAWRTRTACSTGSPSARMPAAPCRCGTRTAAASWDGDRHAGLAPVRALVAGQPKGPSAREGAPPLTTTPARRTGWPGQGRTESGADADVLVLDPAAMAVRDVLARGAVMIRNRVIEKKGI